MSIVTMKNKTRATRNVKIQNKINNMGYGNYLKKKVRGSSSCPNSKVLNNTIKSRVNQRINYDQYIISKKICCIRRILKENCKNNITKKKASSNSCQINNQLFHLQKKFHRQYQRRKRKNLYLLPLPKCFLS